MKYIKNYKNLILVLLGSNYGYFSPTKITNCIKLDLKASLHESYELHQFLHHTVV